MDLGITVKTLHEMMPNVEYHQWRAFYEYRHAMREMQQAKRGR